MVSGKNDRVPDVSKSLPRLPREALMSRESGVFKLVLARADEANVSSFEICTVGPWIGASSLCGFFLLD